MLFFDHNSDQSNPFSEASPPLTTNPWAIPEPEENLTPAISIQPVQESDDQHLPTLAAEILPFPMLSKQTTLSTSQVSLGYRLNNSLSPKLSLEPGSCILRGSEFGEDETTEPPSIALYPSNSNNESSPDEPPQDVRISELPVTFFCV